MQTYEINLWLDKTVIEKVVKQFENDEQVMDYIKNNFDTDPHPEFPSLDPTRGYVRPKASKYIITWSKVHTYVRKKGPKVKARLKKAFDYATKRKEASKKKTERMKKLKEELIDKLIDEEINLFLEKRKLTKKPSSETSLRDWFKRKGAKGKKGGWVDCNAPDGKGGYKACGRTKGEKRKKYPACRPTPAACRSRGKGKKWGKKSKKSK